MKKTLQTNNVNFSESLLAMIRALPSEEPQNSGQYLWSKKETVDGAVIGYAIGDDVNSYPDGAWYNGFYWEAVDSGSN